MSLWERFHEKTDPRPPEKPEDMPYDHQSLLMRHVFFRGVEHGSYLGLLYYFLTRGRLRHQNAHKHLLQCVGKTASFGILGSQVYLFHRMRGCGEIEWKDRTFRLLKNTELMQRDYLMFGGGTVAMWRCLWESVTGIYTETSVFSCWGRFGIGSLTGLGLFYAWNYGLRGRMWDEEKLVSKEYGTLRGGHSPSFGGVPWLPNIFSAYGISS